MKTSTFLTMAFFVCIILSSGVTEKNKIQHYPEFYHFRKDIWVESGDWVWVENKQEKYYQYTISKFDYSFNPYDGFVKITIKEKSNIYTLPCTRYTGKKAGTLENNYIEYYYEADGIHTLIIKARVSNKEIKPEDFHINVEILTVA